MIVSHKHKFIFLKTKKTAGTSIELALSPFCGDSDILAPLARRGEVTADRARCAELEDAWLVGKRAADLATALA